MSNSFAEKITKRFNRERRSLALAFEIDHRIQNAENPNSLSTAFSLLMRNLFRRDSDEDYYRNLKLTGYAERYAEETYFMTPEHREAYIKHYLPDLGDITAEEMNDYVNAHLEELVKWTDEYKAHQRASFEEEKAFWGDEWEPFEGYNKNQPKQEIISYG